MEKAIHDLINVQRQSNGLNKLSWDEALSDIARDHSSNLIRMGRISHIGPSGDDFLDRYNAAGYDCQIYTTTNQIVFGGENVFWQSYVNNNDGQMAYSTVTGWMQSPGHKANLLNNLWEVEGIGVSISANGEIYVTQNFC